MVCYMKWTVFGVGCEGEGGKKERQEEAEKQNWIDIVDIVVNL